MSLESISAIADQATQNLLGVGGAVGAGQVKLAATAINQQVTDLLQFPNTPVESEAMLNSAYLRATKPPVGA